MNFSIQLRKILKQQLEILTLLSKFFFLQRADKKCLFSKYGDKSLWPQTFQHPWTMKYIQIFKQHMAKTGHGFAVSAVQTFIHT